MPIRLLLQLEATAVSIILYMAWRSSLVSVTREHCSKDPETALEYCATYDVTVVWLLRIVRFIEHYDGTIVALFTIILGVGTIWLAVATRKLAIGAEDTAERQLRAYINVRHAV